MLMRVFGHGSQPYHPAASWAQQHKLLLGPGPPLVRLAFQRESTQAPKGLVSVATDPDFEPRKGLHGGSVAGMHFQCAAILVDRLVRRALSSAGARFIRGSG